MGCPKLTYQPEKNHPVAIYTYDASGQRIVKYNFDRLDVFSNAQKVSQKAKEDFMIYPSGLITGKVIVDESNSGNRSSGKANPVIVYTKHFYAGNQRVASKRGVRAKNLGHYPHVMIHDAFPNLDENGIHQISDALVTTAGETLQGVFGTFDITQAIPDPVPDGLVHRFIYTRNTQIFYFHPDHLGSSNYITNLNGNISQHMEYLPFGESLVEEHKNSNNSPYKFNGKELDEETGNYYYGARYYDPKWSIWLSVDPMAEKYPGWSPYNYTLQNPVRYTDPTGMTVNDTYGVDKKGNITHIDNKKYYENGREVDKLISSKTSNSTYVDKGVLENKYSQTGKDSKGNDFSYDILKIRGDKKASSLFEFMADNTNVEWSQTLLGKTGENGLNYLTTSQDKATEKGVTEMINTQFQNGYTIRGHIHNHPGNTPYPSGLYDGTGDMGFSKGVTNWYNKKYKGRTTPFFKIYTSGNGKYINYNKNSTMSNFRSIQLPAVNIKR